MKSIIFCILFVLLFFLCFTKCGNRVRSEPKDELKVEMDNDSLFCIPFVEFKDDSRIFIKVKINNIVDATLCVDNGASELLLCESFAKKHLHELDMTLFPNVQSMSNFPADPSAKSYIAKGEFFFQIKDSIFKTICHSGYGIDDELILEYAHIIPDNQTQNLWNCALADGTLPLEVLAKNGIIFINNEKKRIEFPQEIDTSAIPYPYKQLKDKRQVFSFPFYFKKENIKEKYLFETLLDLGANTRLFYLLQNSKTKTILEQIKNCASQNIITTDEIKNLLVFSKIYAGNDTVEVQNVSLLPQSKDIVDLWLGMPFLSNYNIFFDYQNQTIYLKTIYPSFSMAITNSILFGCATSRKVLKDSSYTHEIIGINPNNIKIDAQIKDRIIRINNLDISNYRTLSTDPNDTSITVIRRNDTITLYRK